MAETANDHKNKATEAPRPVQPTTQSRLNGHDQDIKALQDAVNTLLNQDRAEHDDDLTERVQALEDADLPARVLTIEHRLY